MHDLINTRESYWLREELGGHTITNNTIPTINVAGRFSILISNVNTYKPLNNLVSNNMIFGKDVSAESGSPDASNTIINNKWN